MHPLQLKLGLLGIDVIAREVLLDESLEETHLMAETVVFGLKFCIDQLKLRVLFF